METIYLASSTMVLIRLLTILHHFFFLYGYQSFYPLFENCTTKGVHEYFDYKVSKYVISYHICYDLQNAPQNAPQFYPRTIH